MGWGWHGWYMGWMWISWIAIILLIVWFVVRAVGAGSTPVQRRESPEEILKHRSAKGEISREDYERMLSDVRR
jgi:uncharacterized membrane protein